MGRPSDPDYWKKWRAAHPEYQDRERSRSRKRTRTPEQRRVERAKAKAKAARARDKQQIARRGEKARNERLAADPFKAMMRRVTHKHTHRLTRTVKRWRGEHIDPDPAIRNAKYHQQWLELAHEVAALYVRPDRRSDYEDPLYADAVAEALVAIYEKGSKGRQPEWAAARAEYAVRMFVRGERSWRVMAAPLLLE